MKQVGEGRKAPFMSPDNDVWPPPPTPTPVTDDVPAPKPRQDWLALLWALSGAACMITITRTDVYSRSQPVWVILFVSIFICVPAGFWAGFKSCRTWQGIAGMIISAVCSAWIARDFWLHR